MKKFIVFFFLILPSLCLGANLLSQADLLTAVRTILDETDSANSAWTNTELRTFINDAGNGLVNMQLGTIEKFDTISTTINGWLFNLNSDFLQVTTVLRLAGIQITPCQQVKPEEIFGINIKYGDTLKIYYAIFGNDSLAQTTPKIIFRPTSENIDTFIVLYNAKPKFLVAGTDTLTNIAQPYRTMIPYIAASLALRSVSRHLEADKLLESQGISLSRLPEKQTQVINR